MTLATSFGRSQPVHRQLPQRQLMLNGFLRRHLVERGERISKATGLRPEGCPYRTRRHGIHADFGPSERASPFVNASTAALDTE